MSRIFKANRVTIQTGESLAIEHGPMVYPEEMPGDTGLVSKEGIGGTEGIEGMEGASAYKEPEQPRESPTDKDSLLEKTKKEVDDILKAAVLEGEAIKEAAREGGFAQGKEAGYQAGYEEARSLGKEIELAATKLLEDATQERQAMLDKVEPAVIDLITNISKHLVGEAALSHPKLIQMLIKKGLTDATILGEVTVFVCPSDYENVEKHKEAIIQSVSGLNQLTVMKDSSLEPMDCIIETAYGNIDCSLGEQLEALERFLYLIYENDKLLQLNKEDNLAN